jgi:integrase
MHLLQAGNDITVIALWLGHESPATTLITMLSSKGSIGAKTSKIRVSSNHLNIVAILT